MPQCFQLIRDGRAVEIADVDHEMCCHFDEPCDPRRWYMYWYDIIGRSLAHGRSFDQVRAELTTAYAEFPELAQIADWLEANFTVRHWYEMRSHPR